MRSPDFQDAALAKAAKYFPCRSGSPPALTSVSLPRRRLASVIAPQTATVRFELQSAGGLSGRKDGIAPAMIVKRRAEAPNGASRYRNPAALTISAWSWATMGEIELISMMSVPGAPRFRQPGRRQLGGDSGAVLEHENNGTAVFGGFLDGVHAARSGFDSGLRFFRSPVPDFDVKSGFGEVDCHGASHEPGPDKSDGNFHGCWSEFMEARVF